MYRRRREGCNLFLDVGGLGSVWGRIPVYPRGPSRLARPDPFGRTVADISAAWYDASEGHGLRRAKARPSAARASQEVPSARMASRRDDRLVR